MLMMVLQSIIPTNKKGYILEIDENVFNKDIKEIYELIVKQHDNPRRTTYKDISIHKTRYIASFEIIKKVNKNNLKAMQFDYNNDIITSNILENLII